MARAKASPGNRSYERAQEIERYRVNWVRHLLGIADDLHHRVVARLEIERGYNQLRPSLGPFLWLVWRKPRPLTRLAQELRVSRQGCAKLLRIAEEAGYAERVDGIPGERAQHVRLTERGRHLVDDAVQMIFEAESTYAERISEARLHRFRTAAATLFYGLGLDQKTDPSLGEAARRSISVLPVIAQCVEEELRQITRAKGHDVLQISHARVIGIVGVDGARASEISRTQGVSRQATSATIRGLETLGYVQREADEADGRGVRVVLAARGEALIHDTLVALDELENRFGEILGTRRLRDLLHITKDLHEALSTENDVVSAASKEACGDPPALDEPTLRSVAARLRQQLGGDASTRLGALLLAPDDANLGRASGQLRPGR